MLPQGRGWVGVVHDLELFDATQGPVKVRCVKYLPIEERNTGCRVEGDWS